MAEEQKAHGGQRGAQETEEAAGPLGQGEQGSPRAVVTPAAALRGRRDAAAMEEAAAVRECAEVCRRLAASAEMAEEAWEREMEAVLERMRAAHDAVFEVRVALPTRACASSRLVDYAAWFGSRAVLEEGCARTAGGPTAAAHALDANGCVLLNLAVQNRRLSVEDIEWVLSLNVAAASTANRHRYLPLHVMLTTHSSLTAQLVNVMVQAFPRALQSVDQSGNGPLHYACLNAHMTSTALAHLVSFDTAAAGTANMNGDFPLHLLARSHILLTPELVDAVAEAYPQALQRSNVQGNLPLHQACLNDCMAMPALCHLVARYGAAAGTPNESGNLPLHLLVGSYETLSPELVDAVLAAHPSAPQHANRNGDLPLHYACANSHMTADGFRSVLCALPEAAATRNGMRRLPFHLLSVDMSDVVRSQLATLLMETIDALFPCEVARPDNVAHPALSGPSYVPPAPDRRWASHKHPLSQQGRLKAGLRVAVRGRENAWQFQTGAFRPGREVMDDMPVSGLVKAGHRTLVRQRLARLSTVERAGVNEVIRRALELGHVDVVRDLLIGGLSDVQASGTARQSCQWLGALMRHPQLDYGWLVDWMAEQCGDWDGVDLDWLCLEAAALTGDLSLVESMAAAWQTRADSAPVADGEREALGKQAVAGGSVAVLHWLQGSGLVTPSSRSAERLSMFLIKHDRLEMLEELQREYDLVHQGLVGVGTVHAAVEGGALRTLRWLHVHTRHPMSREDMRAAVCNGHRAVVHFLHRHRDITRVQSRRDVLADAVRRSPPGIVGVVEYVLRHQLCGDDAVTERVVVGACMATTVRVDVVRYVVSRAREAVLRAAEAELTGLGCRQPLDVFRAARLQVAQRSPSAPPSPASEGPA